MVGAKEPLKCLLPLLMEGSAVGIWELVSWRSVGSKLANRLLGIKVINSLLKKLSKRSRGSEFSKESTHPSDYVEVTREEIEEELANSWKDSKVPQIQFDTYTKEQLENYRRGLSVEPYDVLVRILKDNGLDGKRKRMLEVGCSTGYYSEVLKIKAINSAYSGCDYSESFIEFATRLYPGIDFQVQDACSLTYPDGSFDIVISGCCLLHIMNYEKAIEETARIAKEYVVFHRTPVLHKKDTSYYIKTAYGVKMFEIHFNERELLKLFDKNNLKVIDIITFNCGLEKNSGDFYAYKTYLCMKS